MDLISSIPFQLLEVVSPATIGAAKFHFLKVFRVFKIFRLVRLLRFKALTELEYRTSQNPGLIRMIKLIFTYIFILHLVACFYWYICTQEGFGVTEWVPPFGFDKEDLWIQYGIAYYWAIISTIGNVLARPELPLEYYFSMSVAMIGVIVSATIVGSAASLVNNMDKHAAAKKEQLESMNQYMKYREVPQDLQRKVRSYIEYTWQIGRGSNNEDMFDQLPSTLRLQLLLAIKRKFIESVQMFQDCSPECVIALVKVMNPSVALPNEIIMEQGQEGREMYFIARGLVYVYIRNDPFGDIDLGCYSTGAHFGEIALLQSVKRTATVKALTFCDLQVFIYLFLSLYFLKLVLVNPLLLIIFNLSFSLSFKHLF